MILWNRINVQAQAVQIVMCWTLLTFGQILTTPSHIRIKEFIKKAKNRLWLHKLHENLLKMYLQEVTQYLDGQECIQFKEVLKMT